MLLYGDRPDQMGLVIAFPRSFSILFHKRPNLQVAQQSTCHRLVTCRWCGMLHKFLASAFPLRYLPFKHQVLMVTYTCRVVETSSYAMDRDANSDTSSDTPLAGTNAGALTSQGSRAVQPIGTSAKDFLLRNRTYTGMQTPATGAPLKAASLAAPGMTGRAAAYSQEAR